MDRYCAYYQAEIEKSEIINLVSILKSFDNVCFDRCFDKHKNIFEFFVPKSMEPFFLRLMAYFEKKGIVRDLKKMPNRLKASN